MLLTSSPYSYTSLINSYPTFKNHPNCQILHKTFPYKLKTYWSLIIDFLELIFIKGKL